MNYNNYINNPGPIIRPHHHEPMSLPDKGFDIDSILYPIASTVIDPAALSLSAARDVNRINLPNWGSR